MRIKIYGNDFKQLSTTLFIKCARKFAVFMEIFHENDKIHEKYNQIW